jgi:hypothetical protein
MPSQQPSSPTIEVSALPQTLIPAQQARAVGSLATKTTAGNYDKSQDPLIVQPESEIDTTFALERLSAEQQQELRKDCVDYFDRAESSFALSPEDSFEREMRYLSIVGGAIERFYDAVDGNKTIVGLHDVDWSAGVPVSSHDKNGNGIRETIFRPGFKYLPAVLRPDVREKFLLGFFSSINQDEIQSDVVNHSPKELEPYVDEEFCISTYRNSKYANYEKLDVSTDPNQKKLEGEAKIARIEDQLAVTQSILSDDFIKKARRGEVDPDWFDTKEAIAAELAGKPENADVVFIRIDDLDSVLAIDPNGKRVRGVHISDDIKP